jgi:hypothetical protein
MDKGPDGQRPPAMEFNFYFHYISEILNHPWIYVNARKLWSESCHYPCNVTRVKLMIWSSHHMRNDRTCVINMIVLATAVSLSKPRDIKDHFKKWRPAFEKRKRPNAELCHKESDLFHQKKGFKVNRMATANRACGRIWKRFLSCRLLAATFCCLWHCWLPLTMDPIQRLQCCLDSMTLWSVRLSVLLFHFGSGHYDQSFILSWHLIKIASTAMLCLIILCCQWCMYPLPICYCWQWWTFLLNKSCARKHCSMFCVALDSFCHLTCFIR